MNNSRTQISRFYIYHPQEALKPGHTHAHTHTHTLTHAHAHTHTYAHRLITHAHAHHGRAQVPSGRNKARIGGCHHVPSQPSPEGLAPFCPRSRFKQLVASSKDGTRWDGTTFDDLDGFGDRNCQFPLSNWEGTPARRCTKNHDTPSAAFRRAFPCACLPPSRSSS